jgi:DNA polymerase elongation subunit (family B)
MKRPREHERTDAETKALEAVAADMRAVRTAVCKAEDAFDAARVAVPVAVPASDPAFAHASFPIPAPVSAPAPEKRDRGDHKEQEKDNKGDKDKGDKGDKNKAKLDLSSSEMFRLYRAGASDPVKRWPIVEYCARDCDIPLLLVEKLKYVTIWVEMSRVCFTPLEAVVNAGQQQKVFNVIARYVNQEFAINVRDAGWPTNDAQDAGENEDGDDGGARSRVSDYQGATVIEPIKGFYSLPVSTLDFASLYPSIIRFYNLCPSVLVIDEEFFNWDKNPACKGRVTFERHTIPHNIVVGSSIKPGSRKRTPDYCVEERTYIIVTHVPGVLPRLLAQLGTTRKIAKKAMVRPLFCCTCIPICLCLCLCVYAFLFVFLQEHAGARSSECDSVASFLRGLCLSASPQTAEVELSALKAQGKSAADKLRTAQLGVDIGTAAFRVSPAASDSDCSALSEARSFEARVVAKLNERSESVRAELQALIASGATEDTARKQRTLVRELEMFAASVVAIQKDSSANATTTEAEPGTGTAPGTQRTQIDTSLLLPAFSKHIASYSQQAKAHYLDMSVQNGRQLGIKITMNSVYGFTGVSADKGLLPCKPVAAITTLKGRAFIGVAKDYAEKTYAGARVIYGDTDSIMIYWGQDISIEDAYARGGDAAAAITALLRSGTVEGLGGAGYEAARIAAAKAARAGATDPEDVDTEDEEEDRDRDRDGDGDGERDRDKDKDKHRVKRSPVRDFEEARKAIELTNEKVYFPYLLDKKKRYAGLHWAMDEELGRLKSKLDMKGIDAVRRDRPGYVRSTCEAVLRALMFERSVSKAREHIEASLESILASSGRGSSFDTGFGAAAVPAKPKPISEFVMSKSVRGSYKNGVENLPQVQAWRRMQARGDDDIPPIGARMPYVIVAPPGGVAGGTKSQVKLFARSEHPSHVKSVGLPLDIVYYLEQLQKPVSKLVEHVGIKGLDELFDTTISRANAKLMGLRSLARFLVTDTSHSTASAAAPVAAPVAARVPRAPIRIGTLGPHKTFAEPLFAPRSAQSLHQTQHKTQQQTQFARHFGASSKAEPEKAKSKSNESKVSKDGNPKPIAKPPRSSKSLLDMLEHA